MKKMALIVVLFATVGGTLASCGGDDNMNTTSDGGILMNETFYNPLDIKQGIGDPWLYKHGDYYYYTHSSSGVVRVTRTSSPTQLAEDFNDETRTKVIFRQKSIDRVEIWAPEIFFFDGHWYCYFTAARDLSVEIEKDASRRTYGMKSVTDDIFGEWETAVEINIPEDIRSIDATFFEYQGKQYIVYAGWPNKDNLNYRQHLYINELESGNPLKVAESETVRHLISEPTNSWEIDGGTAQNEGPCVAFAPDGTPVLFYSGSYSGGDNYCIAYLKLTGSNILEQSSWEKCEEPLMEKDMEYSEIIAPGHNSIFKSPDGSEDWICYHAAKKSGSGRDRQIRLQKLSWDGNTPVVEEIYKASDEAPLPSGDNVTRYKYEAESTTLTEDCYQIDAEGFASNDVSVSISDGGNITFEVSVPENGKYAIGVRYSNRDSSEIKMNVNVNGVDNEIDAPNTLYDDTYFMSWFFNDLYIKRDGLNVISIECDPSIYIDCIVIDYLDHK